MGERVRVTLACTVCNARNYSVTRKKSTKGQLEFSKFCPTCAHHTSHKETK